jgi:predicted PurR-regulated permease PerM
MKEIPSYIKFAMVALGGALAITGMILGKLLLVPFVWAVLLTLMVLPIAGWLEKHLKRRTLSSILTVFILIIVGSGILILLTTQATRLAKDGPLIEEKLIETVDNLRHFVDENLGIPYEEQGKTMQSHLSSSSEEILGKATSTLQNTLTTMALMVVIPIYLFFLLNYRERFTQFVIQHTTFRKKAHTLDTMNKISRIAQQYLRGVGIELVIMTCMSGTVFFALGIRHALFFAVLVAVLNIIPYLGVLIGNLITVTFALLTTDSLIYPLLVFLLLWVIQIVDNNFIVPYVVGQQIKLNPLAVILAVVLGGLIWGVSGMILFIPILGMVKVIFDESESMKSYGYLLGDGKR